MSRCRPEAASRRYAPWILYLRRRGNDQKFAILPNSQQREARRVYASGSLRLYPQVEEDRDGMPTPDEGRGQADGAAGRDGELSAAQDAQRSGGPRTMGAG